MLLRGWSLSAKNGALLGAYALSLAAVYGGFTTLLLRREAAVAEDRLRQTAQLVAVELDTQLEAGRGRLEIAARLPGLVHGLQCLEDGSGERQIAPWTTLHYVFFRSPIFTGGVFLLDKSAKVLWTEPPGLPWLGSTLSDLPPIAALYQGAGDPVSAGLDGDRLLATPHVVVGFPIEGPDGEVAGLLGGIIDLTAGGFTDILHAVPTTGGRHVSIVDQHDRVIASTDPAQLLAPAPAPLPDDAAPLASATLAQAGWRIVAGEPRETALAPIWQLQRMLLAVGIGMLVVALALGSLPTRGFVRAIQRLTRSAEVMAGGDLSQPVAIADRHRELATLARTFERVRTELSDSHAALTQRLAERDELLGKISRELRTPLNVIFGYTDILLEDQQTVLWRDTLLRIRGHSEQLLQLVRDLMTLSGLKAGKIELEIGRVSVEALVARLRPLAERLARGRPIAARFDYSPDMPTIETDPLRLEQVLTNLLTNAFKFTVQGSVTLRVRDAAAAGTIVFEVVDTGIGIPEDQLPYIFDEFRQVDGSMSRQHGGLGLGLALVRRLLGLLGGEVGVDSRPGEGSTFTVTVPVACSIPHAAPQPSGDACDSTAVSGGMDARDEGGDGVGRDAPTRV